jgi:hypothetical protein
MFAPVVEDEDENKSQCGEYHGEGHASLQAEEFTAPRDQPRTEYTAQPGKCEQHSKDSVRVFVFVV